MLSASVARAVKVRLAPASSETLLDEGETRLTDGAGVTGPPVERTVRVAVVLPNITLFSSPCAAPVRVNTTSAFCATSLTPNVKHCLN